MRTTNLDYIDHDGARRTVSGCSLTSDGAGRHWLWSEQLEQNLAYKARSREDCLLSAIDLLLFIVSLKDERLAALQRIATLAEEFAGQVNPGEENDHD